MQVKKKITNYQDCSEIFNAIQKDSYKMRGNYSITTNNSSEKELLDSINTLDRALYHNTQDELLARHQGKVFVKEVMESVVNSLSEEDKQKVSHALVQINKYNNQAEKFGEVTVKSLEPVINFQFQNVIARHAIAGADTDMNKYANAYAKYLQSAAGGSHFPDKEGCTPEESAQNKNKLQEIIAARVEKMIEIIADPSKYAESINALTQIKAQIIKEKGEEFDKRKECENVGFVCTYSKDGKTQKYLSQQIDITNLPYEAQGFTKPLPLKDDDPSRL